MPIVIDLAGRLAVVTGAARGLGAAISARLAEAGAAVVMADIDGPAVEVAARVVRDAGGQAHPLTLDVTRSADVAAAAAAIGTDHGTVSILVNNAGILRNAAFGDLTDDDWSAVLDTHLGGTMMCTRALLDALIQSRGAVVNVSSGAVRGSDRGHAGYSAAKAAIVGLTRTLAVELGPLGVRVNAVAPGATESEMTRRTAEQLGVDFATYAAEQSARIPLRRLGQPADVANVVCFLASELSAYITGETVFVAGGPVGAV
jgi:3-oxoacyl-[acyl-carrier protein] reductase